MTTTTSTRGLLSIYLICVITVITSTIMIGCVALQPIESDRHPAGPGALIAPDGSKIEGPVPAVTNGGAQ